MAKKNQNQSMFDAAVDELLGAIQEEYEKSDQNWKPEPGDYLCQLSDLFINVFNDDDGNKILSVTPVFLVVAGQNEGRLFRERFTDRSPMSLRFLRQFMDRALTAEEFGLEATGNLREDLATLKSLAGRLFLTVRTTRSKKDPQYINASVVKVESVGEEEGGSAEAA